jgi:hypothetical protein
VSRRLLYQAEKIWWANEKAAEPLTLRPQHEKGQPMQTLPEVHGPRKVKRDRARHCLQALSDMIRNLEALIELSRFDLRLSLALDDAQLWREQMNEGRQTW